MSGCAGPADQPQGADQGAGAAGSRSDTPLPGAGGGRPGFARALELVLSAVQPSTTEYVALHDACGRVLRADIVADRDLPPFNRATMDGYALRAEDLSVDKPLAVVATISAGTSWSGAVPAASCVAIATGAPVPDGLDTVIEHERSDRRSPVRLTSTVPRGNAIHRRGADARAGDILLRAGVLLGPQHVGVAAAVGACSLPVAALPSITILTSGDEVVDAAQTPLPHQVRNSNAPMLVAAAARFGGAVRAVRHLPDDRAVTIDAVGEALTTTTILVTVGGISAGERDWFADAFEAHHVEPVLRGAAIQPGGPVTAGRAPNGALVIALPGNPVSALVCAHLFLQPAIRRASGLEPLLEWIEVVLREPVRPNPTRQAFRPAHVDSTGHATVCAWSGSGDLFSTISANAIVELPIQREAVPAGAILRAIRMA